MAIEEQKATSILSRPYTLRKGPLFASPSLRHSRIFLFSLLAALTTITGCATVPNEQSSSREAYLRVENQNWNPANIYIQSSGHSQRIGEVPSLNEETLKLRKLALPSSSRIHLQIRLFGSSETYTVEAPAIAPGETLTLRITPSLTQSYFTVLPEMHSRKLESRRESQTDRKGRFI